MLYLVILTEYCIFTLTFFFFYVTVKKINSPFLIPFVSLRCLNNLNLFLFPF